MVKVRTKLCFGLGLLTVTTEIDQTSPVQCLCSCPVICGCCVAVLSRGVLVPCHPFSNHCLVCLRKCSIESVGTAPPPVVLGEGTAPFLLILNSQVVPLLSKLEFKSMVTLKGNICFLFHLNYHHVLLNEADFVCMSLNCDVKRQLCSCFLMA
jgi:hypothetical protein